MNCGSATSLALPTCLIGIEACASSHHWSRQLQALGHTVRLMPPAYVTSRISSAIQEFDLLPNSYLFIYCLGVE
jgi:transposase